MDVGQQTFEAIHDRGVDFALAGDLESADRCWVRAAGMAARPETTYCLGVLHLARGRRDEALTCFERAIARLPDRPEPRVALGVAYALVGAYSEATAAIGSAARLQAGFGPAQHDLAIVYAALGREDEARRCRALAAQAEPAPTVRVGGYLLPLVAIAPGS